MDVRGVADALGGRTLPLPTYPFERSRYWVPEDDSSGAMRAESPASQDALRALVRRDDSDSSGATYLCELRGDEFFLQDHVIGGHQTFPGVAYMEVARAAAAVFQGAEATGLQNVVWATPLRVPRGERCTIRVTLRRKKGAVDYELATGQSEARVVHGQGTVLFGREARSLTSEAPTRFDVPAIADRCEVSLSGEKGYGLFAGFGYAYGPRMQGMCALRAGETESLATLALPDVCSAAFRDFVLHPTLMDSALQAVNGVFYATERAGGKSYLPFSVKRISWTKELPRTGYAYAVAANRGGSADKAARRFDVYVLDDAGEVVLTMSDVTLRGAPSAPAYTLVTNRWVAAPADETPFLPAATLVVGTSPLARAIQVAVPGALSAPRASGAELPGETGAHCRVVVALEPTWERGDVAESLRATFDCVLGLANRLGRERAGRADLVVVGRDAPDGATDPAVWALHALLRSIAFETPLRTRQILVRADENVSLESLAPAIRRELARADVLTRLSVSCEGLSREVSALEPVAREVAPTRQRLKASGNYLVTGGLGAIGKLFTSHLAQTVGATVVLAGRRAPSEEDERFLEDLRGSGARVEYVRVDVGDLRHCYRLRDEVLDRVGRLDGILHVAGVNRDALARDKSGAEIDEVLHAKVNAIHNLDKAFSAQPLEFVALFSSLAGTFGNAGQTDYAYANAYMDQFARTGEGRFGGARIVSIGWPLWAEGRMRPDEETIRMMGRLLGIRPLQTKTALAAFTEAVNAEEPHFVVVEGDAQKLLAQFAKASRPPPAATVRAAASERDSGAIASAAAKTDRDDAGRTAERTLRAAEGGTESPTLRQKFQKYLIHEIAKALKVAQSEVDVDRDMAEFGFDSIMRTKLSNDLNDRYGCETAPSAFFEYPTVDSFTDYFLAENGRSMGEAHGSANEREWVVARNGVAAGNGDAHVDEGQGLQ